MSETVHWSDFERRGVSRLLSYMEREQDARVLNYRGREMSPEEQQQMINESKDREMSRHLVLSPSNSERLERDDLERVGKDVLRDELGDRDGVRYAYAVHEEDGDRPHLHVAAPGRAQQHGDPLWLDQDDLEDIRERTHERALERERRLSRTKSLAKQITKGMARGR